MSELPLRRRDFDGRFTKVADQVIKDMNGNPNDVNPYNFGIANDDIDLDKLSVRSTKIKAKKKPDKSLPQLPIYMNPEENNQYNNRNSAYQGYDPRQQQDIQSQYLLPNQYPNQYIQNPDYINPPLDLGNQSQYQIQNPDEYDMYNPTIIDSANLNGDNLIQAINPNMMYGSMLAPKRDQKLSKLREMKLLDSLDRQTHILEEIAANHDKQREQRQKAELKKMKNRLEKLENEEMLYELRLHQTMLANDIANNNNQLIFSHINAEAQTRSQPVLLTMPPRPMENLSSPSSGRMEPGNLPFIRPMAPIQPLAGGRIGPSGPMPMHNIPPLMHPLQPGLVRPPIMPIRNDPRINSMPPAMPPNFNPYGMPRGYLPPINQRPMIGNHLSPDFRYGKKKVNNNTKKKKKLKPSTANNDDDDIVNAVNKLSGKQ